MKFVFVDFVDIIFLLALILTAGIQIFSVQNIIVFIIIVFLRWFVYKVHTEEYLRDAWRQIRANKLAVLSLIILSIYLVIGMADSVSWRDPAYDQTGKISRDTKGKIIYEPAALSVLDRVCTNLRNNTEKTYSSPLARKQFTKETVELPDGTKVRDYPDLKYPGTHIFGTDVSGYDVFFRALKGVRTGLIIGGLTTILIIPFAMFFGIVAGYFGKWIDDVIQYIYTTLASIPGILLIASFMLLFGRGLIQLCIIMGITSWTSLCRLLRGETLKIRELEYIQSAQALGVKPLTIIYRHIVPNVMHIVLIVFILNFSDMVLAEAVLSYIGIGVGPNEGSWGNMINQARMELARDPLVWWNLISAFLFMFGLVLPANIFGDAVRDALDPKLRVR